MFKGRKKIASRKQVDLGYGYGLEDMGYYGQDEEEPEDLATNLAMESGKIYEIDDIDEYSNSGINNAIEYTSINDINGGYRRRYRSRTNKKRRKIRFKRETRRHKRNKRH